jgi:hypothetical protein
VDAATGHPVPYRRIGTILVERGLITENQLAHGLAEQKETGRPLGEICVERFELDRLSLADALAEQWEEMQRANAEAERLAGGLEDADEADELPDDLSAEDELRVLLEEAEAARTELVNKTDELSRRLAALETLVVGVSDALAELRPENGDTESNGGGEHTPRQRRARSNRRGATPRSTSA